MESFILKRSISRTTGGAAVLTAPPVVPLSISGYLVGQGTVVVADAGQRDAGWDRSAVCGPAEGRQGHARAAGGDMDVTAALLEGVLAGARLDELAVLVADSQERQAAVIDGAVGA